MAQLIALMLAAINGVAPAQPQSTPAQVELASLGLQQAARQAPRVPISQLVPVAKKAAPPVKPARLIDRAKPHRKATKTHTTSLLLHRTCQKFQATVYGPPWGGIEGTGWSATGIRLVEGRHVVAVDSRIIPLGSRVTVQPNPHGWDGEFIAGDTGGAIQGHIIDIFMWQGPKAMDQWGRRSVTVCRA